MNSDGERIDQHVQLVRLLRERDDITVEDALELAGSLIPTADREAVLDRWRQQTTIQISVLDPISLLELGGPRSWYANHDPSQGYYWRRQRRFLAQGLKRGDFEIDSLDKSSNTVLSHLEDPRHSDPFLVKGLVIGYVQSGKTANFSALIAKAADAGYKVVIVLSGLHNTLRQQTQRRLQRDLGREDGIGVGPSEPGRQWVWLTGSELWGDFNPGSVDGAVLQGNEQVILIVKKNKSRLERLIAWMDGKVPSQVPVLVIDDEADQASINTGENMAPLVESSDLVAHDFDGDDPDPDELSPSAINFSVRRLLRVFERCSYVAYTATPFANALIHPLALDQRAGVDLFPSDFILSLPPPPGEQYVGPERLFGRDRLPGDSEESESDGLDVIDIVPDYEVDLLVPPRGERDGFVPTIPPSLDRALIDFILGAAGRVQREDRSAPCTMLVHTDMRRAVQNPLAASLEQRLAEFRQHWMYDRDDIRPQFEDRWNNRFRPVTCSVDVSLDLEFYEIERQIDRILRVGIPIRILNSDYSDEVDFDAEPDLVAVVVGGNKLSRGVTLEGLLISYYVRESPYYDTLMQMGRWFGYRGSYVDLTRLYSTRKIVNWFRDLATAEEELRRHLAVYERRNLKPTAIVPKIRKHPVMQITARNKMQDAREVAFSYDGEFRQTFHFPFDDVALLQQNLEASRRFLQALGPPALENGRPCWSGVSAPSIVAFLGSFHTMTDDPIDPMSISQYIHLQVGQNELIRWRVLVCGAKNPKDRLGTEDLGVVGMPEVPLLERSRKLEPDTSCGVITDKDDETHGLTDLRKGRAEQEWADRRHPTRAHAFRAQRSAAEGLLLIYPISKYSRPRSLRSDCPQRRQPLFSDPERGVTVMGYALSFPYSDSAATVEYVAGPSAVPGPAMSPSALLESWSNLPRPESLEHLEASETTPGSLIWLARDHTDLCHLLIQVPDGGEVPESATKGLSATVARHRIPEGAETDCIDLVCLDEATLNVFAAVAAELVVELEGASPERRPSIVAEALARWRWFWDVATEALSEREALGLFAELWFLDQWAGVTPESVMAWGGDDNTRHDFQWSSRSVEVKATARRGDGGAVHTVQHLDQLADPEVGALYLFSLRVVRDRLAANTLAVIVSRCSEQLRGSAPARDAFLRMVSRRGYTPADASLREASYRIVGEDIYEVTGDFPRLTAESFPDGLPEAVTDVSYKIDMTACEPWWRQPQLLEWLDHTPISST